MKNQKGYRESIRHASSLEEIQTLSGRVNQILQTEEIPQKTRRRIVLAAEKRTKELKLQMQMQIQQQQKKNKNYGKTS